MLYCVSQQRTGPKKPVRERKGDQHGIAVICTITILLFCAVYTDLITGRIKNQLIGLGLVLGLSYRILEGGPPGLLLFLGNMALPILCLYFFYHIRALGAGDVKLLSMLGGFLTTTDLFSVMLYSFFCGAVLGLPKFLRQPSRKCTIHFSVAILFGYLATVFWHSR